jgi:pyrroloquinoline quinone (PQQ) biosynthesis protein C
MHVTVQDLYQTFDASIDELGKKLVAYPWHDRDAYISWVAQTFYLVNHTSRLLCLSAARCNDGEDEELLKKTLWHLKEEWGHEEIARTDLRHLGLDIAEVPELAQTSLLYQANYYFIHQWGPYSILGYSLMLEGLAAAKGHEVTAILTKLYGPKACKFFKVHAEEDDGHVKAGMEFMTKVSPAVLTAIHKNLVQSRVTYGLFLDAAQSAAAAAGKATRKAA